MGGGAGGGGFKGTYGGKPRRQTGKTPMNNQKQNEQFKTIVKKLKLNKDQARQLHDEISGKGMDYQEILAWAKDMFNK